MQSPILLTIADERLLFEILAAVANTHGVTTAAQLGQFRTRPLQIVRSPRLR